MASAVQNLRGILWIFTTGLLNDHYFHLADLNDIPKIKSLFEEIQPDYIVHLAAQSLCCRELEKPGLLIYE